MWSHRYEHTVDIPVEQLWPVLANVQGWIDLDENIERLEVHAPPAEGTSFSLKPKGAPTLKFIIADFKPPNQYSDVCRMPMATMKTLHTLLDGDQTKIVIDIMITGPLSWLWGPTVGKKHANGLPAQTTRFIDAATNRF